MVVERRKDSVWKGWNNHTQRMHGVRFAKHRALVVHYVSMQGWALHILSKRLQLSQAEEALYDTRQVRRQRGPPKGVKEGATSS